MVITHYVGGMTLLSSELMEMKNFKELTTLDRAPFVCSSAIFDSHANVIAGDFSNKDIFVLNGINLNLIQI